MMRGAASGVLPLQHSLYKSKCLVHGMQIAETGVTDC